MDLFGFIAAWYGLRLSRWWESFIALALFALLLFFQPTVRGMFFLLLASIYVDRVLRADLSPLHLLVIFVAAGGYWSVLFGDRFNLSKSPVFSSTVDACSPVLFLPLFLVCREFSDISVGGAVCADHFRVCRIGFAILQDLALRDISLIYPPSFAGTEVCNSSAE